MIIGNKGFACALQYLREGDFCQKKKLEDWMNRNDAHSKKSKMEGGYNVCSDKTDVGKSS